MKKFIFTLIILNLISGCATGVSSGKRVFITAADSAHLSNCKMLGQVQVDANIAFLWDRAEQISEIKNRLRDAAAQRYPAADTITHSDMDVSFWFSPDSVAMATAFKCFA